MTTSSLRPEVLVADPDRATLTLVRSLLLTTRGMHAIGAPDYDAGWRRLKTTAPAIVFVAHLPPRFDAPQFTRQLRRSDLPARRTPVLMLAADPTPSQVRAARDAGVDEVLRKPFAAGDLLHHVDKVLAHPRVWVEGASFVGPDRRRSGDRAQGLQHRRRIDTDALSPQAARIYQALAIMKAAIAEIDHDPRQALRALNAQTDELACVAKDTGDDTLAGAAKTLRACLRRAVQHGRFSSRQVALDLADLIPEAPRADADERIWWVT